MAAGAAIVLAGGQAMRPKMRRSKAILDAGAAPTPTIRVKLLLDTHIVLWAMLEPQRLSQAVHDAILDDHNDVGVSAATGWEIAIKQGLGKLDLPGPAEVWLPRWIEETGFTSVPIAMADVLRVRSLPPIHRDPFDRLLVAQALGGWTLVTHDETLRGYGVPILI